MKLIDLTPIVQALIALLCALITYKLIPWIRSRTTESQQSALVAAAKVAVFAAEQIYGAGNGEQKLDYALAAMRKAGYDMNKALAREAVEAAVKEMQDAIEGNLLVIPGEAQTEKVAEAAADE